MDATVEELCRAFGGAVVQPGNETYEASSGALFAPGRPAAVLRPRSVGDVQAAIRFVARSGLALSVRGGGHGFPGFATNDGGVVIDLSLLATVEIVDAQRHLVRVGGGATWGQVADALAPHGLAISAGDTRSVGVGGLTLSGGIGWKVRRCGLALDQLVGAEVVLADGTVVRASADEHPELFWAIRGGGGNFGIVTSFDFAAHPTSEVFFGALRFPPSEVAQVLTGWADHLRAAPDALTSVVNVAPSPGESGAPIEVCVAFDGDDPEAASAAIEPLRRLGTVLDDDVTRTPYAATLADGGAPPPGLRFVVRSGFVDRPSVPQVLRIVADTLAAPGAPAIALRSVSGAAARVPVDATAYAHRKAELVLVTLSAGPEPVVAAAAPVRDAMWERLAVHVDGAYANFLSSATGADVAAAYPTETFRRLAALKRRYDPANLFAGNHNVPPSGDPGIGGRRRMRSRTRSARARARHEAISSQHPEEVSFG